MEWRKVLGKWYRFIMDGYAITKSPPRETLEDSDMRLIELDRSKLYDDLGVHFMKIIYATEHPGEYVDSEQLINLYKNDSIFNRKVSSATAITMQIFLGYIDGQEQRIAAILAQNGINKLPRV